MDLVTNLQSTKQIVPAIGPFDNPTPGFESRISLAFLFLLSPRLDVRDIPPPSGRIPQSRIVVSLVAAQMLARLLLGRRSRDHHRIQRGAKLVHIVPVGARERDRQRDALRVREDMPLGAQFAPIRRVFSGLVAPPTGADTVAESSDWKPQSIPWRSS